MKKYLLPLISLLFLILVLFSRASAQCDKPVIISEATTVCPGGQTTLFTNPVPGATYQWSDGGPATASRPAGPGKYAVTVTHGTCSETSDTIIITETTIPTIYSDKFPTICPGETLTLTAADTGNYWVQKSDFPGPGRIGAVAAGIGSKGYFGLGAEANNALLADWWEYDDATGVWTQKADFPGAPRNEATTFALDNKVYVGTGNAGPAGWQNDFYKYDPFLNTWTEIAPFPGGRAYACVSFVAGGRGYTGAGYSSTTANTISQFWSYDPATDTWTPIPDLPGVGRMRASGFSVDGKGYVSCGFSYQSISFLNDCYEYDPATNSWTPKASLPADGRQGAAAFTIGDHAYLAGGWPGSVPTKEVWEFYNGIWTRRADFGGDALWVMVAFGLNNKGIVLSGHVPNRAVWEYRPAAAITWPDGSTQSTYTVTAPGSYAATVQMANGCTITSNSITVAPPVFSAAIGLNNNDTICEGDSVKLTALSGDNWTQKNDFLKTSAYTTALTIGSDGYFLGAGNGSKEFYRYDQSSDTWVQLPDMPMAIGPTVAVSWKGKGWVYGDFDNAMWMYDPVTGQWTKKAVFPGTQAIVAQGFLLNDHIYIAGGVDVSGAGMLGEVWAYDLENDTWTQKNDLPYETGYGTSFAINGKGYICTGNSNYGVTSGHTQSDLFLQYDPVSDSWTELSPFPGGPRGGALAFTDGHKAYVGLGNHTSFLNDLWQFDPSTLTWTRLTDMPVGRYATRAMVLGQYAYIGTGVNWLSGRSADMWQYELPHHYQWTNGQTGKSVWIKQTGDYGLTVTTNGGCTGTASSLHIEVQPATRLIQVPADTAVCADAPLQFTANATGLDITYQWQFNSADLSEGGAYTGTQTNMLSVADAAVPGTGLFRCIATGVCGADTSAEAALTLYALPAKPVITPNGSPAICDGDALTLSSSAANGNTWSTGVTGQNISVGTAGSYTVFVTDNNGCTSPVSDAVTVTVNPLPAKPAITAGGPVDFCAGGTVALSSSTAANYTWSNGATTQNIDVNTGGSYTVQVKDANGCVSPASDPVTVTVYTIPAKPAISLSGATDFCEGGSVTLTSSANSGNAWSTGDATTNIIVQTSGVYTVQQTDANGCASPVSDPVTITVHPTPPQPVITAGGPLEFCAGNSVTLSTAPAAQYRWSNGSGSQAIEVNQSGIYTVQITDQFGCASPVSQSVSVVVNPLPSGTITTRGPFVSGNIRYMELQAPATPGAGYRWNTGENTSTIRATKSGDYRVVVTSAEGCPRSFNINMALVDFTRIPNTFTPNSDGRNDYWKIPNLDIFRNARVTIFNRNGNKVYEAIGSNIRWDGTFKGQPLPAGIYYYVLDLHDGGPLVNGWINLMK